MVVIAAAIVAVGQQKQNDDEQRPRAIVTAEQVFQTHTKAPLRIRVPM